MNENLLELLNLTVPSELLGKAVERYLEIKQDCTESGCACPHCGHIESAICAIGETVLYEVGLVPHWYLPELAAELKANRQPPAPQPKPKQFVYLMRNERTGFVKIGLSAKPAYRESTLQDEQPLIELIGQIPGNLELERALHEKYATFRVRGEWFNLSSKDIEDIIGGV